ncbi:MAG: redox-sensing transcriptional repressor Rex [Acidobacteriales bacterium]|nr:redox-sensing transcriptional repressor Rex [Terriglobales bacterium]
MSDTNQPATYRVPEPTLHRLPDYYRYLQHLEEKGASSVSCSLIGRDLSMDPTLVRKDLESIAMVGRPGVGFRLNELIPGIGAFLGYNGGKRAVLAGAGSLGTALLGHRRFAQVGLQLIAAFDNSPLRVGERVHDVEVRPIQDLAEYVRAMDIHLGIITVPAEAAQKVADLMVEGGIRAIWNFAPVRLHLPPKIIVQNEDLYNSLAALSHRLAVMLSRESRGGKSNGVDAGGARIA